MVPCENYDECEYLNTETSAYDDYCCAVFAGYTKTGKVFTKFFCYPSSEIDKHFGFVILPDGKQYYGACLVPPHLNYKQE